jgi:hypothetical protein
MRPGMRMALAAIVSVSTVLTWWAVIAAVFVDLLVYMAEPSWRWIALGAASCFLCVGGVLVNRRLVTYVSRVPHP